MNYFPAVLAAFCLALPAAAQEEFREFIETAGRMAGGGRISDVETDHFVITATPSGADLLGSHGEKVYAFLKEMLGVEPAEKIKITFFYLGRGEDQMGRGVFEKYDPETETLYFQFDYDWRRDLARGIVGAYLHKLAKERIANIPAPLFAGLKSYVGNFEGKVDAAAFHTPVKAHLHIAKRAQALASRSKLVPRKFADFKEQDFVDHEPAVWALAGYLLTAKGKRDELKAWFAAHVEGKEAPAVVATESDVTRWASGLDVKLADREETKYLVADTMYYTIYVQKGTKRTRPAMNDKAILDDLKKRMDLIYIKYAQAFRVDRFINRRPKLYYYRDQGSYVNMGGSPSALAHYMPLSKTLMAWENPEGKVVSTFHVLAHEGCHQFFDLAFPGFFESDDNPTWFSEGLAECFGSCELKGGEFMIFTNTGSAAENAPIIRDVVREGAHTPFKELFEMSHRDFMMKAGIHYPQSWSICHFLWNAGYKEVIVRLIEGFKKGKPRDEVYSEAFVKDGRKLDIDALEREWAEYAKRMLR